MSSCPHCKAKKGKKPKSLAKISLFIILTITLLLLFLPVFGGKSMDYPVEKGTELFFSVMNYFLQALPWILIGVVLGGLALEFIPRKFFFQQLGGTDFKTIIKAAFAGIFIDVCSHGALAIGMSLYKARASYAATITFLLATPWIGFMETALLLGFLGPRFTVIIIIASFISAILIGVFIGFLERKGMIPKNAYCAEAFSPKTSSGSAGAKIRNGLKESWSLFKMIGVWLFIGFLAAGLVFTFVEQSQVESLMGYASGTSLPFTLIIASVIEICSEGSVPLVGAFKSMGASAGAIFVFLMAGVATDYTELGLISDVVGRKAALATAVIAVLVTLAMGYLINYLWVLVGW